MSHISVLHPRNLAWLPAAMLIAWGVLAAAGVPLNPNSNAASSGNTTVIATVDPELHINSGAGLCAGLSITAGTNLTPDGTTDTIGDCTLRFGTNNVSTGSLVRVRNGRPNDATIDETFCAGGAGTETAACAATKFTDVAHTGAASLAANEFGVLVNGAPTCAGGPVWTNGNYYGLRDANEAAADGGGGGTADGYVICDNINQMGAANDAIYALRFAANPDSSQPATAYRGQAVFQVLAS